MFRFFWHKLPDLRSGNEVDNRQCRYQNGLKCKQCNFWIFYLILVCWQQTIRFQMHNELYLVCFGKFNTTLFNFLGWANSFISQQHNFIMISVEDFWIVTVHNIQKVNYSFMAIYGNAIRLISNCTCLPFMWLENIEYLKFEARFTDIMKCGFSLEKRWKKYCAIIQGKNIRK